MVKLIANKIIDYINFPIFILESESDRGKAMNNGKFDCHLVCRLNSYDDIRKLASNKSQIITYFIKKHNSSFAHVIFNIRSELNSLITELEHLNSDEIFEYLDNKIILWTRRLFVFKGPGSEKAVDFILSLK